MSWYLNIRGQMNTKVFSCDVFYLKFLYACRSGINFSQVYTVRNIGTRAGRKIITYL